MNYSSLVSNTIKVWFRYPVLSLFGFLYLALNISQPLQFVLSPPSLSPEILFFLVLFFLVIIFYITACIIIALGQIYEEHNLNLKDIILNDRHSFTYLIGLTLLFAFLTGIFDLIPVQSSWSNLLINLLLFAAASFLVFFIMILILCSLYFFDREHLKTPFLKLWSLLGKYLQVWVVLAMVLILLKLVVIYVIGNLLPSDSILTLIAIELMNILSLTATTLTFLELKNQVETDEKSVIETSSY